MAVIAAQPPALLKLRSYLAYLALAAGVLVAVPGFGIAGAVTIILAILLGWHDLHLISRLLFALVVLTTGIALWAAPPALIGAAENMTRLTALIITVMLLSTMLGRSRDLGSISSSLFKGKPLARYFSVTFGTAFLAMPLNFGSVGVVATMIGGEVGERGDSATTRNASRAMLRGFGASPICSPLSISVVITLTFLPGLKSWELIALSLPLAIAYLSCSALFREPEYAQTPTLEPAESKSRLAFVAPWLRFAGIIGAICVATFALSAWADFSYSRAVTLSCLGAVVVGLANSGLRGESVRLPSMASLSNEMVIIGGSAFLGVLVSTFALQLLGEGFNLPHWTYPLVAFAVPWLFFTGGMVGLNPIVIGTLVGGILSPIWPADAILGLGIAMVSGWGLTTAGTPYSANSLLLERLTGYSAQHAALRWNMPLSALSLTTAGLVAAALTYGWP